MLGKLTDRDGMQLNSCGCRLDLTHIDIRQIGLEKTKSEEFVSRFSQKFFKWKNKRAGLYGQPIVIAAKMSRTTRSSSLDPAFRRGIHLRRASSQPFPSSGARRSDQIFNIILASMPIGLVTGIIFKTFNYGHRIRHGKIL
jgi:hypothetical protein